MIKEISNWLIDLQIAENGMIPGSENFPVNTRRSGFLF